MANPVQWSIDQFYSALQSVWSLGTKAKSDLAADRTQLMHLWDVTKTQAPDVARAHQAILTPLIHQNSVLRTQYLAPLMDKYKTAVNAGSSALRAAGFTAPTLAGYGMGAIPIIIPAVAIAAIIVALSAASIIANLTDAQRKNTATAAAIIGDASLTPAQRASELAALATSAKAVSEAATKNNPFGGFNLGDVVPILALVAAILIVPKVLPLIPRRRAAA